MEIGAVRAKIEIKQLPIYEAILYVHSGLARGLV